MDFVTLTSRFNNRVFPINIENEKTADPRLSRIAPQELTTAICFQNSKVGHSSHIDSLDKTTATDRFMFAGPVPHSADLGVRRIVPFVKPSMCTRLEKEGRNPKSPWFDKQRHLMLRDNLTREQRLGWQKQIKTLYWDP